MNPAPSTQPPPPIPLHAPRPGAVARPPGLPQRPAPVASRPSPAGPRVLRAAEALALTATWVGGVAALGLGRGAVAAVLAGVAVWSLLAAAYGLHGRREARADRSAVDDLLPVVHVALVAVWPLGLLLAWLGDGAGLGDAALLAGLAVPAVLVARLVARAALRTVLGHVQPTIVVGAGHVGRDLAARIRRHPEFGLEVVGFVDAHPPPAAQRDDEPPVLGGPAELRGLVERHRVERVVVAFTSGGHEPLLGPLRQLERTGVQVDVVPRLFEALGPRADLHRVEGLPLIALHSPRPSRAARVAKRTMDVVGATVALVACAPLLAFIAARIWIASGRPVIYRSERIGRDGRRFALLKFRTMRLEFCRGERYGGDGAERAFTALMEDPDRRLAFERAHKLDADPRVFPFGRFLRRTSLDELPQLINVLRGDLALVGPRPITLEELPMLDATATATATDAAPPLPPYWQMEHLRPGLTGLWQISGRSHTSYGERLRLDSAYAATWSLGLDVEILARTVRVLVRGTGAG